MNVYLAGCGKLGTRLGETLHQQHRVIGLKRSDTHLAFPVLTVDLSNADAVEQLPCDADIIVFTVTPSRYDAAGYRSVYETALGHVIDWANRHDTAPLVILVSSTGVYGQQNGDWVDENSVTQPDRATSQWIVFGESQLQARLSKKLIVRFSGIYGNGRNRLIDKALSGEAIQQSPPLWTNRIHEDDCIGVLAFFIEQYHQGAHLETVYIASDDSPVSQYDICAYICAQYGKPPPPMKTTDLSHNLNKRCRNQCLKALGYQFKYPDYRLGYLV